MSADPQTDWGLVLPREALHAVMRGLHRSLPSSHTDTPEDWARRDRAAMAAVGALRPADAMEGELAAQIVSARAWAKDCLQLAVERQEDFGAAVKCKAQALSMMREVKSAWNLLLKVQAARRAVEQDETASTQAEWIEYAVIKTMAEVLPELARPEAAPEAAPVCEPQELIEVATEITAEEASELEQISYAAKNSTDACRETEPRSRTAPAREAEFA
jgi:hypothetical protein